ncbi:tol-pal system protein YbgF [Robbsia sp. KACC 23696]|uniref:tol-pal system protein YbgF n=1 Tax=Robbsia sp. KACC 23696 TaxID=3149231 RepID=UPI00325B9983
MQRNSFTPPSTRGIARTAFVALLAWGALSAAPAHAFSDDEARKAILDLRQRLDNTNAQLSAAQRAVIDLQNRNDQLNQQVAQVRGQNEDLQNQLTTVQQTEKDYYSDLDGRLKKFEPQQQTVDGVQGTVQPGESTKFNAALQQFRSGDYKGASSAFSDFADAYPQSPYRPTALFWLGNAYYALRDYKKSNATLKQVVDNYPTHPRAPDALLQIATNQAEQNERAAAKKTLQQVVSQYAGTPSATTAQDRLSKLK